MREAIKSGALVSVLDDWCAPFPGPFLYYPSRRQPPPALAAFVAFVAEWRKRDGGSKRAAVDLDPADPTERIRLNGAVSSTVVIRMRYAVPA